MEIALYSKDLELQALCQQIIRLTPGGTCTLRTDFQLPPPSPSDVCIYDSNLGPVEALPEQQQIHSGIVIVSRAELSQVRTKMLHLRAIILLRPVNRARLEIAIEQSLSHSRYVVDSDLMRLNRDELLECLLHASLRLQEYDQNRSHFLARAIHELRAPLTSLNGYCGLLLDGKLGALSNEQTAVLERIQRSVERLTRIVSTMFDLSTGRSSESQPDYRTGDLIGCAEQALHEIEPQLRERRIHLDVRFQQPAGELCFDEQHMEQVFLNLLDNSCKFAGREGMIRVVGYPYFWERRVNGGPFAGDRRQPGAPNTSFNSYRIDISDNGPGIPPDQVEQTFDESTVYSGGNDRSGAGLGLAIARMLVRQHQGHIWAESKTSQGTTFCVVIAHQQELT